MTKLFLNLSLFFISFTPPLFAQTLKGRVVDETTQQPIVGVGVQVIGTSQGTITNTEGEFALNVTQWPVEVVFSHVSYQTQKVKAKTNDFLTSTLTQRTILLPEVVVGNEAEKIMREVIKKITENEDNQYFKAFFQKISLDGDTYTKLQEFFLDVHYKNTGIQRIYPTHSRYAELTNQRFEQLNLFRQSLYYARMIDSSLHFPVSPSLQKSQSYKMNGFFLTESGNRIAIIDCKIKNNTTSFEGQIFVDTNTRALQRIEGTYSDENEQIQSETEIILNYRVNKKSGLSSFDHLQLTYTLKTKDIGDLRFTEKVWLLFLEDLPEELFENTKSYSPFLKSIQKKAKQTPYNGQLWQTTIPIKQTKISEAVIQEIEKNGLFKSNYN